MKKSKQMETGLIPATQIIGAELGQQVIKAAQAANRDALKTAIVAHVQDVQMRLKKQQDYILSCQSNIALLEAKLQAIAAGEITISNYGHVTYADKSLQRTDTPMRECINCGAPTGGRS